MDKRGDGHAAIQLPLGRRSVAGLVAEEAGVEAHRRLVKQGVRGLGEGRQLLRRGHAALEKVLAADSLDRKGHGKPGAPGHERRQQGALIRPWLLSQRLCSANHFILALTVPRRQAVGCHDGRGGAQL